MAPKHNQYQLAAREGLEGFFARTWTKHGGHSTGLAEPAARSRFDAFVSAAYDEGEAEALAVAVAGTADLHMNHRAMENRIVELLEAGNPQRAAKLYAVALCEPVDAKFRRALRRGCAVALLLALGAAAVSAACYYFLHQALHSL